MHRILEKRTKLCINMLEKRTKSFYFTLYKQTNKSYIIPLEVKSGKDYQRHVALNNLLTNAEYHIHSSFVLCNENVSVKDNVLYAPVYMTMFLHHSKQEGPIIYLPELP